MKIFIKSAFVSLFLFSVCQSVYAQNLADSDNIHLFKDSYEESRSQFLKQVATLETTKGITVIKKSFPSPRDPNLITDVVLIKTQPNSSRLQVYNSGLHGIEGYVGSAIQSWILKNKISEKSSSDYLFIHALNPYGFKNNRRVNESNIDLNRNFVIDPKTFQSKNPSYAEIYTFLNPTESVVINFFSRAQFIVSAVNLVLRSSLDSLRRAILVGQYQFPKGISFGGIESQYQTALIQDVYHSMIQPYDKVLIADLHTGYGEKNKLHLLANSQNVKNSALLQQIFSKERVDLGDQKHFYNVSGDLLSYLLSLQQKPEQIVGVAFEFGTANSQTILGSIESLRRMVLENQKFHFKAADLQSSTEVERLFLELFYPQNDTFKIRALQQASEEIAKIDAYLQK